MRSDLLILKKWRVCTLLYVLATISNSSVAVAAPLNFKSDQGILHRNEITPTESECLVNVRLIHGSGRSPEVSWKQLETGVFLSDVRGQLQPLPFSRYKIIDSQEKLLRLETEGAFVMKGSDQEEHQVTVRPHGILNERVRITASWRDKKGEELVSTKLAIPKDKTVVLGTDTGNDTAAIVCIHVSCEKFSSPQ